MVDIKTNIGNIISLLFGIIITLALLSLFILGLGFMTHNICEEVNNLNTCKENGWDGITGTYPTLCVKNLDLNRITGEYNKYYGEVGEVYVGS